MDVDVYDDIKRDIKRESPERHAYTQNKPTALRKWRVTRRGGVGRSGSEGEALEHTMLSAVEHTIRSKGEAVEHTTRALEHTIRFAFWQLSQEAPPTSSSTAPPEVITWRYQPVDTTLTLYVCIDGGMTMEA